MNTLLQFRCSAGFQPSVSQACSLRGLDKPCSSGFGLHPAEWNSAIRQTGSLRYAFGRVLRKTLNAHARGWRALPAEVDGFQRRAVSLALFLLVSAAISPASAQQPGA